MFYALYLISTVCVTSVSARPEICLCRYSTTLDQQLADVRSDLERADAVFVGEVTSVIDTVRDSESSHFPARRAIIALQTVWKGSAGRTATVLTGMGGGEGGIQFTVGERYLVFATAGSNGVLFTKWCSRTGLLASVTQYLPALGELRVRFALPDSGAPPR